jgi:Fe-S oxidoreductase
MDRRLLHAKANLAWHYLLHTARRLLPRRKRGTGIAQFRRNYLADGIAFVGEEERRSFPSYQRCIACDVCLASCELNALDGVADLPMSIPLSLSRSLNEIWSARNKLFLCVDCGVCESRCPFDVPISEIAIFARGKIFETNPGALPELVRRMASRFEKGSNIFGDPERELPENDGASETSETVLFLGCQMRGRDSEHARLLLRVLDTLGFEFSLLDEKCCGALPGRFGVPRADRYVKDNFDLVRQSGASRLVVASPDCFGTLSRAEHQTPELTVEYILDAIPHGLGSGPKTKVAYIAPCQHPNPEANQHTARQLLTSVGADVVESQNEVHCCGGPVSIDDRARALLSAARVREAREAGAAVIVSECPSCVENCRSAAGNDGIRVISIYEFILNAFEGKPST